MSLPCEALSLVAWLALTPAPTPAPAPVAATLVPWSVLERAGPASGCSARDRRWAMVASLGASLAWDLADLPRHQADGRSPLAGSRPGALFVGSLAGAGGCHAPGGMLAALITRWNTLYPPYALAPDLELTNDR